MKKIFEEEIIEPADQDAKADAGKLKLSLVPTSIIRDIAVIRMYGTKKYKDPNNWKNVTVERYRDAAYRHFLAYLDDPDGIDMESGYPHLWHLACNIAFLCELEDALGYSPKHMIDEIYFDNGDIVWPCDFERPCKISIGCARNGGDCAMTTDSKHMRTK